MNEIEKRMLYQMEGNNRYEILNELSMSARYVGNPARRKASQSLIEKLHLLSEDECFEIVQDIQKISSFSKWGGHQRNVCRD